MSDVTSMLLIEAKKYILDPDQIINGFDMRFEWASPDFLELTSYSLGELTNLDNQNPLIFDTNPEVKLEFLQKLTSKIGVTTLTCLTKNGTKLCVEAAYKTFQFDNETYMVLKTLKTIQI